MTDDKEIENAGRLVRLLIGNRDISKKEVMFSLVMKTKYENLIKSYKNMKFLGN